MLRRDLLRVLVAAPVMASCSRKIERCAYCGMKVDPTNVWTAELVGLRDDVHRFDTPKCALLAWRTDKVQARAARFQEFYERRWREGESLVFAVGSDVLGPMGGDAVPIDPARAGKFATDHAASRVVRIGELTLDILRSL